MPERKSVSGSSSHITKVCNNLKSAIWRWRVVFPMEDMGDQSVVCRLTTAGSIQVLYQRDGDTRVYHSLKHILVCTVTVGQSEISPMLNCWGCVSHPCSSESSSLLQESSSSLKYPSHPPILRRNPFASPKWWPYCGAGVYGRSLSMNLAWYFPGVWPMGSVQGVPWAGLTMISRIVLGLVLVWSVTRCVAPMSVYAIPAGMSSSVPVCTGVIRMAIMVRYRMVI